MSSLLYSNTDSCFHSAGGLLLGTTCFLKGVHVAFRMGNGSSGGGGLGCPFPFSSAFPSPSNSTNCPLQTTCLFPTVGGSHCPITSMTSSSSSSSSLLLSELLPPAFSAEPWASERPSPAPIRPEEEGKWEKKLESAGPRVAAGSSPGCSKLGYMHRDWP